MLKISSDGLSLIRTYQKPKESGLMISSFQNFFRFLDMDLFIWNTQSVNFLIIRNERNKKY